MVLIVFHLKKPRIVDVVCTDITSVVLDWMLPIMKNCRSTSDSTFSRKIQFSGGQFDLVEIQMMGVDISVRMSLISSLTSPLGLGFQPQVNSWDIV